MANFQIALIDGVMDFSGPRIIYKDRKDSDTGPVLPYKAEEVKQSGPPERFLRFMESNFPDWAIKEAVLYFLSLVPAREPDYKYIGIFYGGAMTGKTATIEIMREALPGYIVNFPVEALSSYNYGLMTDGLLPVGVIDGKGAAVIQECPCDEQINTRALGFICGSDIISARERYRDTYYFIPTAQIVFCTNRIIDLGGDKDLFDWTAVFHFTQTHKRDNPNTRMIHQIISDLRPEFPGMIRFFIERFIKLRDTLGGRIPEAPNCQHLKQQFYPIWEANNE